MELDERFFQSVKLGNGTRMRIEGKGSVLLKVDGHTQVVPDVFYVPQLKNNLLSIGQLQEKGLAILFQQGKCSIYHSEKGLIMETVMSGNRMYSLSTV